VIKNIGSKFSNQKTSFSKHRYTSRLDQYTYTHPSMYRILQSHAQLSKYTLTPVDKKQNKLGPGQLTTHMIRHDRLHWSDYLNVCIHRMSGG